MFLLNLRHLRQINFELRSFTSHYVPIKSTSKGDNDSDKGNTFTSHYVPIKSVSSAAEHTRRAYLHPIMFLLNQDKLLLILSVLLIFTSHYVPIKSKKY